MDRRTAILHLQPGARAVQTGLVRRTLGVLPGVVSLALDAIDAVAVVRYTASGPQGTDLPTLVRAIEDAGLRVSDVAIRREVPEIRVRARGRAKPRAV